MFLVRAGLLVTTLAVATAWASVATGQDPGYKPVPENDDDEGPGYKPPPGGDGGSSGGSSGGSAGGAAGGKTKYKPAPSPSPSPRPRSGGGTPDFLRPSTRPFFALVGLGPSFFALNVDTPAPGKRRLGSRFKVAVDFGWHFFGAGEGPAIGATIEQSFLEDFYVFNPAAKFWWDIQVTDMAIYIAPFGKLGYGLLATDAATQHAFNLGAGAEGRVVFIDRWMVFARPIQLDLLFGNFFGETVTVNFELLIGGGATF